MSFTGLLDKGFLYQKYEEDVHEGMRLGRNQWLDGRSLAYMVENSAAAMSEPLQDRAWERVLPILDQGSLGSCTGNAGTGALGTQPFFDSVGKKALRNHMDAEKAQEYAVRLYSRASAIDAWPGKYPPDDTGSSGLAICKVLKRRGVIDGYRWARTAYGFLRLLQSGPVLVGMPWYNAFYEPNRRGFIDARRSWPTSGVSGGHEVVAVGVRLDPDDAFDSVITCANSWGTAWGRDGYFKMRLRTYEELSGMDLKQFVVTTPDAA